MVSIIMLKQNGRQATPGGPPDNEDDQLTPSGPPDDKEE
jgi:hypothetical protein